MQIHRSLIILFATDNPQDVQHIQSGWERSLCMISQIYVVFSIVPFFAGDSSIPLGYDQGHDVQHD